MKIIPSALLNHYAGRRTTTARLWKVTRTDSVVMGFCNHSKDLVVSGVTYYARTGIEPTDVESKTRLAVDNADIRGFLSSSLVTSSDILAGVYDHATVELYVVNWASIADGVELLQKGKLGEISFERDLFRTELRGLSDAYSQDVGELYSPSCRAQFGDARCGINLALYTVTGTLDSVSADGLVLADADRTEPGPVGPLAITAITKEVSAKVTIPGHTYIQGASTYITDVVGMTEINGQWYKVESVVDANNVRIAMDTTAFAAYVSGGTAAPAGNSGYFGHGWIRMDTGASAGRKRDVKVSSPGEITIWEAFPLGVSTGDAYTLVAGCGRRYVEDCTTRYSNTNNFRGEPHLPGRDKILRRANA